jgi:hypothetical protein
MNIIFQSNLFNPFRVTIRVCLLPPLRTGAIHIQALQAFCSPENLMNINFSPSIQPFQGCSPYLVYCPGWEPGLFICKPFRLFVAWNLMNINFNPIHLTFQGFQSVFVYCPGCEPGLLIWALQAFLFTCYILGSTWKSYWRMSTAFYKF